MCLLELNFKMQSFLIKLHIVQCGSELVKPGLYIHYITVGKTDDDLPYFELFISLVIIISLKLAINSIIRKINRKKLMKQCILNRTSDYVG